MNYADIYGLDGKLLGEAEIEKAKNTVLEGEWIFARFNPSMWFFTDKKNIPYLSEGSEEFLVKMQDETLVLHQSIARAEAN